ncbi:hypothetical protein ABZ858_10500 [Streptomyces sp. NPDC047017]
MADPQSVIAPPAHTAASEGSPTHLLNGMARRTGSVRERGA